MSGREGRAVVSPRRRRVESVAARTNPRPRAAERPAVPHVVRYAVPRAHLRRLRAALSARQPSRPEFGATVVDAPRRSRGARLVVAGLPGASLRASLLGPLRA